MMNNKQIDELNGLLEDHSETLTDFYDEGIRCGLNKGCAIGLIGAAVGMAVVYSIKKIKERKKTES
ncbi:MAG: hypothetical protein KH020_03100 [Clostridiales bacterium]|nr:hypothetical protein [Clostridiales bacterium]